MTTLTTNDLARVLGCSPATARALLADAATVATARAGRPAKAITTQGLAARYGVRGDLADAAARL